MRLGENLVVGVRRAGAVGGVSWASAALAREADSLVAGVRRAGAGWPTSRWRHGLDTDRALDILGAPEPK